MSEAGIGIMAQAGKFYLHLFAIKTGIEMSYEEAEDLLAKMRSVLDAAKAEQVDQP